MLGCPAARQGHPQLSGRRLGLDPSLADMAPVSVEQPSHLSLVPQPSGDVCQCCHQGHPETLVMEPQSHCHPTTSQKVAGYKSPERRACGQSSSWHSIARGPTAGRQEAEVLCKAHSKPFFLHASHQGPSVMSSNIYTYMVLTYPKYSLAFEV